LTAQVVAELATTEFLYTATRRNPNSSISTKVYVFCKVKLLLNTDIGLIFTAISITVLTSSDCQ